MKHLLRHLWIAVGAVTCTTVLAAWSAEANAGDHGVVSAGIEKLIEAQLAIQPGGTVVDNEVLYPGGAVLVVVEEGVRSLSQCGPGKFCGWAQSNYSGSFYSTSGSDVMKDLGWTARSYANNRRHAARLYSSSGTGSVCFAPGEDRPTIGSSFYRPSRVYLSNLARC
ncbi:hypothetical protein J2X46_004085 [Nocardioides sp. BE266]|uniref:peptidase inhibitor family I36 protein n=1 Tax=Nocardioides sp. BE266 TaxID=2817725 RepID=UPI0028572652|nr:peptidase inhibitor family I36 protein [Nocardioides sp. BE266]MDR7255083.1 hypothetical protein [Nocardioides sp. BE266]